MSKVYDIPKNIHIHTTYGEFYTVIKKNNFIDNMHQLFTFASLLGLKHNQYNTDKKDSDIFQVQNIDEDNLKVLKGIALMKLDVENGKELIQEIVNYADGGIEIIKKDYENEGRIRLDKYIN
ncbi:MAG: hypothetical protein ACOCRX_03625 [Candidatus Woesearchaeota archaeon]